MTLPVKLKKSDILEVRLPYETKRAFMARCRTDGGSASEAVRGFIDETLAGKARRRSLSFGWRIGALAAAAGAVALAASAPSLARAPVQLGGMDANHDGKVSVIEFFQADTDHDGAVSVVELRKAGAR